MKGRAILSLCDFTGNWSRPYAEAGYEVLAVDLARQQPAWVPCDCCENYLCLLHGKHAHDCSCPPLEEWKQSPHESGMPGQDVRLIEALKQPVHGILAAPPCVAFSKAGAWKWKEKGTAAVLEGLSIVDACLRAVAIYRPAWWALENPAGRLKRWLGPPVWSFQPCDFGDPWTKKTYLWGNFTPPAVLWSEQAGKVVEPTPLPGAAGSNDRTTRLNSKNPLRSATPEGFARAFFESNP